MGWNHQPFLLRVRGKFPFFLDQIQSAYWSAEFPRRIRRYEVWKLS